MNLHPATPCSPRTALILLSVLAPLALIIGLTSGSVTIPLSSLFASLQGEGDPTTHAILWELRLPRILTAFIVGSLLALAGAIMQILLGNPLADPYILGVSGGAATGALLAILIGMTGLLLTGAAFGGALLSTALVFGLAHSGGRWTPHRLLLTGIVVAAGWGALISFILSIAPQQALRGMLFWLMGDLSYAAEPLIGLYALAIGLLLTLPEARNLNLLAHGERQAAALGLRVAPLRLRLYLGASLLTAVAVTLGGSIGFIGLIVPHILRLWIGLDHRFLLPAAVLVGGTLLTLADTLARSLLAPQQLPVGVLTALLGVPLFLYLLHRPEASTGWQRK